MVLMNKGDDECELIKEIFFRITHQIIKNVSYSCITRRGLRRTEKESVSRKLDGKGA
jgi:hypothetical protein